MTKPPYDILLSSLPSTKAAEISEKALQRVAGYLKHLDDIRRELKLPAEQLPIVIDMYHTSARELAAEYVRDEQDKNRQRRPMEIMSMCGGTPWKIPPGSTVPVTTRSQRTFRVEDLSIRNASHWRVREILVGLVHQGIGAPRSGIPGNEFGPGGVLSKLKLETLQLGMDFTLHVEYVGPNPEGEVFEATAVGTVD